MILHSIVPQCEYQLFITRVFSYKVTSTYLDSSSINLLLATVTSNLSLLITSSRLSRRSPLNSSTVRNMSAPSLDIASNTGMDNMVRYRSAPARSTTCLPSWMRRDSTSPLHPICWSCFSNTRTPTLRNYWNCPITASVRKRKSCRNWMLPPMLSSHAASALMKLTNAIVS